MQFEKRQKQFILFLNPHLLNLVNSGDSDQPGPEVIKLEYSLKFKIKCNDWLLVDTQAANHCALF